MIHSIPQCVHVFHHVPTGAGSACSVGRSYFCRGPTWAVDYLSSEESKLAFGTWKVRGVQLSPGRTCCRKPLCPPHTRHDCSSVPYSCVAPTFPSSKHIDCSLSLAGRSCGLYQDYLVPGVLCVVCCVLYAAFRLGDLSDCAWVGAAALGIGSSCAEP